MDKGISNLEPSNSTIHRTRGIFKKLSFYLLLITLFVFLAGHENVNPKIGKSHVDFYLEGSKQLLEISAKAYLLNSKDTALVHEQIKNLTHIFYTNRAYTPAWTINFTGNTKLYSLIELIDSAEYFGIPKTILNSQRLTSLLDQLENHAFEQNKIGQRINLELEASELALLYMLYLEKGIRKADTSKAFMQYMSGLPENLNTVLSDSSFENSLLAHQPNFQVYKKMSDVLPDYLSLMKTLNASEKSINKNILATAFYYAGMLDIASFDSINTLKVVVQSFQTKSDLVASGTFNVQTKEALIESIAERSLLIALNMDRLRKTDINAEDFLFVNIPEYKLYAYAENQQKKEFVVVVGKKKTPTPNVSSKLEKIITNPYWTVPRSITRNELLPKIKNDSTYMARNRYFIIDWKEDVVDPTSLDWDDDDPFGRRYWVRQKYGGGNALGKVKFVFPNKHSVYLHDTPSKGLFSRDYRAYSHGCVRVQNPDQLAQYLSDVYVSTETDSVNIKSSIASRKRQEYAINANVEVHIQYLTCSVNENGRLIVFDDIYKKDKKELEALFSSATIGV